MSKEENNNYELTALLLEEENRSLVRELLEKHGCTNVELDSIDKVKLAYPINKHETAYMAVLVFETDPGVLPVLVRDLNMENTVLRHLIIRRDEKHEDGKVEKKEVSVPPRSPVRQTSEEAAPTPLSNEALEKKIEEILK